MNRSKKEQAARKTESKNLPLMEDSWKKIHARAATCHPRGEASEIEGIGFIEWIQSWIFHIYCRTWNIFVGLLILPYCWMLTDAFFTSFARAYSREVPLPFWQSHEFLMFTAGCLAWLFCFSLSIWIWREPRPLRVYIWCHEFTHALTARMFGGRIRQFHVSRQGGHIVTDRYNFLIALSPYLWPLPTIPVFAVWGIAIAFPQAMYHREWFLAALGAAWMFHISFTAWMLRIRQTDFRGPGYIFSFATIYFVNLLILSLCLTVLAPELTLRNLAHELLTSGIRFYTTLIAFIQATWQFATAP